MEWIRPSAALPSPGIMVIGLVITENDLTIEYICRDRNGNWVNDEGKPIEVMYWLFLPHFPEDAIKRMRRCDLCLSKKINPHNNVLCGGCKIGRNTELA